MDVTITARHCTIAGSVRERAEARVARLSRYEPRMSAGHVIFEEEGSERRAEIRVAVDGAPMQVAKGDGDSFRAALDRALDRITRRLKREREKRVDHQAPPVNELGIEDRMATG